MARKRNGWVPFGEALADLPDPVKTIHDASPQAGTISPRPTR